MVSHSEPADLIRSLLEESNSLIRDDLAKRLNSEIEWRSDAFDNGLTRRDGALDFMDQVKRAFPDYRTEVVATFGSDKEGEVAFELVFRGTNTGHLAGIGATGREVELRANGVASFDNNSLLQELRTTWNCAALMAQLGVRAHMRPDPIQHEARSAT